MPRNGELVPRWKPSMLRTAIVSASGPAAAQQARANADAEMAAQPSPWHQYRWRQPIRSVAAMTGWSGPADVTIANGGVIALSARAASWSMATGCGRGLANR